MTRALWQLLLDEPSSLNCEECFAVLEYYAEVLAGGGAKLLPSVLDHLKNCPHCALEHCDALRRLAEVESVGGEPPCSDLTPAGGSAPWACGTFQEGDAGGKVDEEP